MPGPVNFHNGFARLNKRNYSLLKTPFQVRLWNCVSLNVHTVSRRSGLEVVPGTPTPQADGSQTCYPRASIGLLGHVLHHCQIINNFLSAVLW